MHFNSISRYIWFLNYGHISKTQHILHKCDNPQCINIEHLFVGSNSDNISDKVSKRRQVRHTSLSDKQAYEIKITTDKSSIELSAIYGISSTTVRRIWSELTHKYIEVNNYSAIKEERRFNRYNKRLRNLKNQKPIQKIGGKKNVRN